MGAFRRMSAPPLVGAPWRTRQSRPRPPHRPRRPGVRPAGARRPGTRQVAGVVDRLGLLQIDSVNVFERSHYLPAFSRVGAYDRGVLDRLAWGRRGRLIEYWAHQAAFIPRELWPLFEFRRAEYRRKGSLSEGGWLGENRTLADWLRAELEANGPMPASAIEHDANERRGPWWGWSDVKRTLEWMFRTGEVVCVDRRRFEPCTRCPSRCSRPSSSTPGPPSRRRPRARRARGIRSRHRHRGRPRRLLAAPERAGASRDRRPRRCRRAEPVTVPGWTTGGRPTAAWVHRDARRPRRVDAVALLSPFDPVVWFRPRAERLFDFHYRIEIYTPEADRRFGYYSLPLLVDDRIVGRVDLKSDRARACCACSRRGRAVRPRRCSRAPPARAAPRRRLAGPRRGRRRRARRPLPAIAAALAIAA